MTRQLSILDTGKIAAYRGALRCRVLEIKIGLFTSRPRKVLVNFGGNVPPQWVQASDLEILPGETRLTPSDAVSLRAG